MSWAPDARDWACIHTIRGLSIDGVEHANSGHPGLPMGAAPMAYVLWQRHLSVCGHEPRWPNRDRFVLSAGHGSMLLYSLLHLYGFDLTLEDLRSFRKLGSRTPGHPEFGLTPGVEATTGPLGQGSANAVGMAMAERFLAATFNRPGFELVDHYTYALVSDGDLMEGISAEAASLAGHLGLGRLICLFDSNDVSLDGPTSMTFTEDVAKRYESYGWHVQHVADGDRDLVALDLALQVARAESGRPSLIVVKTTIGFGSPNKQGTSKCHGSPLGASEVQLTKQALGLDPGATFSVSSEVRQCFLGRAETGRAAAQRWQELAGRYREVHPELWAQWEQAQSGTLPADWDAIEVIRSPLDSDPSESGETDASRAPEARAAQEYSRYFEQRSDEAARRSEGNAARSGFESRGLRISSKPVATRQASSTALNALAKNIPWLLGGDADLGCSTLTTIDGGGSFSGQTGQGRNIHFGVREHAMGAIANGMLYHGGVRPYVATFFCFADYMRPAVRLAALNHLPLICVWTHDSVGLGEDGPTHQPVEHLASLRAMPNLVVVRPADAEETRQAWIAALARTSGPTALVLTRQKVPLLARVPSDAVRRGAYVVKDADDPQGILIATGSEVAVALEAGQRLSERGVRARVVSMPSWELFAEQSIEYRQSVLPPALRARVSVEAGVAMGWERWVGEGGRCVSIERYGLSAPGEQALAALGITSARVVEAFLAVVS